MSFTVFVKRYSTEGGLISSKVVVGKYGTSDYDVSITNTSTQHTVTYSSGAYAIEIYNPSGYTFSSIDTNLPALSYGGSLTNGRYYLFTPTNNSSYSVNIYYAPTITNYTVRVRSNIAQGKGKFGQLNTSAYDTNWIGTGWSSKVMPSGTNVAVEVQSVTGYTINSVDYCSYGGEIVSGKYYVKYGLSSNLDIVVHYAIKSYTVSLTAGDGGSVSGGGEYNYGSTATISATPNANYKFRNWSDGSTEATRTLTITSDVSLTAYFDYDGVKVIVTSGEGGKAEVRNKRTGEQGASAYGIIGDTFIFIGTPSYGYHNGYVQLDGSQNQIAYGSNYVINAKGTYQFKGYFTPNDYTIKVSVGSGEFDSYFSGGTFSYGTVIEMWVNINPHYNFLYWEDENGNRVYPEKQSETHYIGKTTVKGDTNYKLVAAPKVYTITTSASPSEGGTTSGDGDYSYGKSVTVNASANNGYAFSHWSDGSTDNPYTFTSVQDIDLIAYFDTSVTITLKASPSVGGVVTGGGTYPIGSSATIRAKANKGYKFVRWSDGNTQSVRTLTTNQSYSLTAYFTKLLYSITGYPTPSHAGEVDGSDDYYYEEKCTLTAYPIKLHIFDRWSDGDYSNPKRFIIESSETFAAQFKRHPNIFVGGNRIKFVALGSSLVKRISVGGIDVYLD